MENTIRHQDNDPQHPLRYGIPVSHRWLVEFVLMPLVIIAFSFWMTSIWTRITEVETRIQEVNRQVTTNTANSENVDQSLKRIETKLDAVIQREIQKGR